MVVTFSTSSLLNHTAKFLFFSFSHLMWIAWSGLCMNTSLNLTWTFSAIRVYTMYLWRSCHKRFHPSNSFHKWLILLCPWSILFFWVTIEKMYDGKNSELCSVQSQSEMKWTLWHVAHPCECVKRPWNFDSFNAKFDCIR